MKTKIRNLMEMPPEIKYNYLKTLLTMANIDEKINSLEAAQFYRFMAKVQLGKEERKLFLKQMDKLEIDMDSLCKRLYRELNEQEKNIVRFSLIKDLMIMMKCDYYEAPEEVELFNEIKIILGITEEHMVFFIEEDEREKNFFRDIPSGYLRYEGLEEVALTTTAIGASLTTFFFSDSFKKSRYSLKKSSHKEKFIFDLLRAMVMGATSYTSLKWLLKRRKNKALILEKHLIQECEKLQERTKRYLTFDIQYLQESLKWAEENFIEMESQREMIDLLKKSLAVLNNTKPQLL
ncbi:hypothetical protein [Clostridium formicaceticum]|nr:hypothetical protein [Clostridium formicaceticum]